MNYPPGTLISFLVAISFAAGLNVYATTAVLGIAQRLHWLNAPAGLQVLASNGAICTSVVLFIVEAFGDKIPYVDLIWNGVHTFIRVPVAALMAYRASAQLPVELQVAVTVVAAMIAALAHGTKVGARVLVSASPEPASNIALSSAEDVVAASLTWFAAKHPYAAGGVALSFVVIAVILIRKIVRALQIVASRMRQRWLSVRPAQN